MAIPSSQKKLAFLWFRPERHWWPHSAHALSNATLPRRRHFWRWQPAAKSWGNMNRSRRDCRASTLLSTNNRRSGERTRKALTELAF